MHFLERDLRTFSTEPFFRQCFERKHKLYSVSLEESILASRLDAVVHEVKAGFAKVVQVLEQRQLEYYKYTVCLDKFTKPKDVQQQDVSWQSIVALNENSKLFFLSGFDLSELESCFGAYIDRSTLQQNSLHFKRRFLIETISSVIFEFQTRFVPAELCLLYDNIVSTHFVLDVCLTLEALYQLKVIADSQFCDYKELESHLNSFGDMQTPDAPELTVNRGLYEFFGRRFLESDLRLGVASIKNFSNWFVQQSLVDEVRE